jgi:hypothetical protein
MDFAHFIYWIFFFCWNAVYETFASMLTKPQRTPLCIPLLGAQCALFDFVNIHTRRWIQLLTLNVIFKAISSSVQTKTKFCGEEDEVGNLALLPCVTEAVKFSARGDEGVTWAQQRMSRRNIIILTSRKFLNLNNRQKMAGFIRMAQRRSLSLGSILWQLY